MPDLARILRLYDLTSEADLRRPACVHGLSACPATGGTMRLLASLRAFLSALFRRSRVDVNLEEELQLHIHERADDLERSGLSRNIGNNTSAALERQ